MKMFPATFRRNQSWFGLALAALVIASVLLPMLTLLMPATVNAANEAGKWCSETYGNLTAKNAQGKDIKASEACVRGYNGGYAGRTLTQACPSNVELVNKENGSVVPNASFQYCSGGHVQGGRQRIADRVQTPAPSGSELEQRARDACKADFGETGHRAGVCQRGYMRAARANPVANKEAACGHANTERDRQDCEKGFALGQRDNRETNPTGPPDPGAAAAAQEEEEEGNSCEAKFDGRVSWAICPIVEGTNSAIDFLDSGINSMLVSDTNRIFGNKDQEGTSGHAYYQAWDNFRKFALGVIFIVALIILIATAFGFEVLDAYTIRKTLPRALLAIILITLSWSIMNFLINFTNDIGNGIRWVIYAPFERLDGVSFDLGASILSGVVLSAGGIALGIIGLLSFAVTALIGVVIAFGILIIRELGLQFLTVVFPIAIALMILPNTQKVWNMAKSALISLLVAFPIITGVIAAGRVFSQTIYANGNAQPHEQIIALFAYILPYFLLLNILAMVGGVTAMMSNVAQRQSAGMMKGLQAYRGNKMKGNLHAMKEGNRFKASNKLARGFNRTTKGIANVPSAGIMPHKWRSRYQAGMSQHSQQATAEYMEKSAAFKAIMGNDDYLQATMRTMGGGDSEADWRRYLSANGYKGRDLEQGVAMIRAAKRDTDDHTFKRAAVVANASTGTGWKEGGAGDMMASINEAAGGDRDAAAQMLAEMRGRAERARRVDLHGAGFGGQMADLNAMNDGKLSAKEATRRNNKKALELQDARTIAGARGDSMKLLAPEMMEEVKSAYASGNDVTIKRSLARAAALYDNAQYSSAENAELIADQMLAQPTGRFLQRPKKDADGKVMMRDRLDASGNKMLDAHGDVMQEVVTENAVDENGNYIPETLRDQIETYRDDREFLNMRRELSSRERMAYGNREAAAPPPPPEG